MDGDYLKKRAQKLLYKQSSNQPYSNPRFVHNNYSEKENNSNLSQIDYKRIFCLKRTKEVPE